MNKKLLIPIIALFGVTTIFMPWFSFMGYSMNALSENFGEGYVTGPLFLAVIIISLYSIYKNNNSNKLNIAIIIIAVIILTINIVDIISNKSVFDMGASMGIGFYLSIISSGFIAIYTFYLMRNFKDPSEVEASDEKANNGEMVEKAKKGIDTTKTFINEKGAPFLVGKVKKINKKVIIVAAIVVGLVVGGIGALQIYENFIKKTEIDVMANVEYELEGESGSGTINVVLNPKYDRDMENAYEVEMFAYEISYTVSPENGTLKNGDKVTIKAKYDEDEAKKLKLKIVNDEKTITVKNLVERYESYEDIDKKVLEIIKTNSNIYINEQESDSVDKDFKATLVKEYFIKAKDVQDEYSDGDCFLSIYQVTGQEKAYFGESEYKPVKGYFCVYVQPTDSRITEKNISEYINIKSDYSFSEDNTVEKVIQSLKKYDYSETNYIWMEGK